MKERTPEQLKGQVRYFATQRGLQPQEVLQIFLLESIRKTIKLEVLKKFYSKRRNAYFIHDGHNGTNNHGYGYHC